MQTALQYYRALNRGGSPDPLPGDSDADEAFGLLKLVVAASLSVRVRRATDDVESDIGFIGDNIDAAAISTFAAGADLFSPILYGQKGTYNLIQPADTGQPKLLPNGLATGKPSLLFGLSSNCRLYAEPAGLAFFRNIDFAVVFTLVKVNGNSPDGAGNLQTVWSYSLPNVSLGSRVALFITGNQAGFRLSSRRVSTDGSANLIVSYDVNRWNLVTSIIDFSGRSQTLRVNGMQEGTQTPIWLAGSSEDNDSQETSYGAFLPPFGGFRLNGEIASWVGFNSAQTLAQIEAVENYLMAYAGIT